MADVNYVARGKILKSASVGFRYNLRSKKRKKHKGDKHFRE